MLVKKMRFTFLLMGNSQVTMSNLEVGFNTFKKIKRKRYQTQHNENSQASTKQQTARLEATAQRMGDVFTSNQVLGRLHTIGCVAVEITQKCNLDCTLCYLSEHSQSVEDIPIEEVFRRLDDVLSHYGPGTHVQITGGDPTLRKHTELVDIVAYANQLGLYTALFTNGIGASRKLLRRLADAGLRDVAFHVDSTQRRENGDSEEQLNVVRQEYLDRTKGLGLMVIFNNTVHKGNFHEIPSLVKFYRDRAKEIGLVSFQLQADTGRGEWRQRDVVITKETVEQQIEAGSTENLPWGVMQVGHSDCHNYLPTLVVNDTVYPLFSNKAFIADFMRDFSGACWDRQQSTALIAWRFIRELAKKPVWWFRLPKYAVGLLKPMLRDVLKSRGEVHQLTFFVQNFMDAKELVQERVDACSFMVMTNDGPVSMCQHNAQRDDYILTPFDITRTDGTLISYQPLNDNKRMKRATQKLASIAVQSVSK